MKYVLSFSALVVALIGGSSVARADGPADPYSIALTYEASPARSCPTADGFRARVEKRTPRSRVTVGDNKSKISSGSASSSSGIRARVTLQARDSHDARAHVTVMGSGDLVLAEREVTGRSCTEIADASALLVALFADRDESAAPSADPAAADAPDPEPPAASSPKPVESSSSQKTESATHVDKPIQPKHLSIMANPLALTLSRYSMQVEFLPTTHHAITLNPFFVHANRRHIEDGQAYSLGTQNGVGGELGYRYYTGKQGPNGFFFGPSLILGSYWATAGNAPESAFSLSRPATYTGLGAAVDLGGQAVIGPGIVFGAGLGVQYVLTTADAGVSSYFEGRAGLAPRVLLSLGYAF